MKRILVTGATGFVGSCLARRLLELGYQVDIFIRSTSDTWRINDVLQHLTVHYVDLRDMETLAGKVELVHPEAVIHLATYGGFHSQKDTIQVLESNLLGTANLLNVCLKAGFEIFINTGSSSEYGEKTAPMNEADFIAPKGAYAISKAAATWYCESQAAEHGRPIVTLRLFTPYGPWDDPRRLIPYIIKSQLRVECPKLFTPSSVRDFIFIEDVLDAYIKVLEAGKPLSGIINIGSGVQRTVSEVAEAISGIVDNGIEPEWGTRTEPRSEPESWVADVEKATSELGWVPSTSLEEGLNVTVAWLRQHLELYPKEEPLS